jgi:hypothetical protein
MRVMFMIKGDPQPGAAPSEELLTAMGSYNDELKKAGVLLDLAGLLPSARSSSRSVRCSSRSRLTHRPRPAPDAAPAQRLRPTPP